MEPGRRTYSSQKALEYMLTTDEAPTRCFATCRTIRDINQYIKMLVNRQSVDGKAKKSELPLSSQEHVHLLTEKKHEPIDLRYTEVRAAQTSLDNNYKKGQGQLSEVDTGSFRTKKQQADKHMDRNHSQHSKQARTAATFCIPPQHISFEQLGGIREIEQELTERVLWPILYANQYSYLGVTFGTGILLHAPTGSGKTAIVHALVNKINKELNRPVHFFCVNSTEIITSKTGETEDLLRDIFRNARENAPSIIFLDNVEIVSTRGENVSREMERRIVSQLCSCLDEISSLTRPVLELVPNQDVPSSKNLDASTIVLNARPQAKTKEEGKPDNQIDHKELVGGTVDTEKNYNIIPQITSNEVVIVIGATSKLNAIDESLRRAGRFDRDIPIPIPSREQRVDILHKLLLGCKVDTKLNLEQIAEQTPGYVGADLAALCREAGHLCLRRIMNTGNILNCMTKSAITVDDFRAAMHKFVPTALREGFATVPDVSLDDIGALEFLKVELDRYLLQPLKDPERFKRFGLDKLGGIIMFSMPGQGKTLICKALSAKAEMNFISVKGPELLNMYYGESERAVRNVFARARASVPCILFLDEFDSLAKRRGSGGSSSDVSDKVVNTLLTELDGLHNNLSGEYSLHSKNAHDQIFIIAATNRIDLIDPGLLRPGRFDRLIYIPLPDVNDRASILYTIITRRKISLEKELMDMNSLKHFLLEYLAKQTKGYTGADLEGLVKSAAMTAVAESPENMEICKRHFLIALSQSKPSVSEADRERYDKIAACYVKEFVENLKH